MEDELRSLLEQRYNLGAITALDKLKDGVSNTNYKVTADKGAFVVRVCRYEPQNQIAVMIPFLDFAGNHDIPTPKLIHTRDGDTHVFLNENPIVVTSFVQGSTRDIGSLSEGAIGSFATSLAKFHNSAYMPTINSATLHPRYILGVYDTYARETLPPSSGATDGFETTLRRDFKYFSSSDFLAKFESLPEHVVHGDLIPGNVMFTEDDSVAAFIDLEEIGRSTRLLDIARVITTWFRKNNMFLEDDLKHFIHTYTEKSPLTEQEVRMLLPVVRYVTFRHAVFNIKMLVQNRLNSLADNEEVNVYLEIEQNGLPTVAQY